MRLRSFCLLTLVAIVATSSATVLSKGKFIYKGSGFRGVASSTEGPWIRHDPAQPSARNATIKASLVDPTQAMCGDIAGAINSHFSPSLDLWRFREADPSGGAEIDCFCAISEVAFPALDASSKDPAYLNVSFDVQ